MSGFRVLDSDEEGSRFCAERKSSDAGAPNARPELSVRCLFLLDDMVVKVESGCRLGR